jgi:error-prone DNA polymerase
MGFYSPFTVVKDAQRHGVRFRAVDVARSDWNCALEEGEVRLGLRYVRGLRKVAADRLLGERAARAFGSLQDMVDRAGLQRDERIALAEVGALNAFGLTRRSALWQVERAGRPRGPLLRDADAAPDPSPLPEMTLPERLRTDIVGTTFTIGPHPMILHREGLAARGIRRAWDLQGLREGTRLTVAGAVVCRQRPATAKGFLFLTLEDETGLANVIVRPDLYEAHAAVLSRAEALEIDGVLQTDGGVSVRAIAVRPLQVSAMHTTSHDFH